MLDGLIDGLELLIAGDFFHRFSALTIKDNKIAEQVQHVVFAEHASQENILWSWRAPNPSLQFKRAQWKRTLPVRIAVGRSQHRPILGIAPLERRAQQDSMVEAHDAHFRVLIGE